MDKKKLLDSLIVKTFTLKKKPIILNFTDIRLICITPTLLKLFEAIIYEKVEKEILGFLFYEYINQRGFVKNNNLFEIFGAIVTEFRKDIINGKCILMHIDLKRAFERVNLSNLIEWTKEYNENLIKNKDVIKIKENLYIINRKAFVFKDDLDDKKK